MSLFSIKIPSKWRGNIFTQLMLLPNNDQLEYISSPLSESSYAPSPVKSKNPLSEMDLVSIPKFLQESYLNGRPPPAITNLRPWQIELFQMKEWGQRQNCLVLVPTAGGKTVAAEVAIAQLLQIDPLAQILYCLPFVSLAAEKFMDFSNRFRNFSVKPFYANIGSSEFQHGSIAVCTFEKAHALINAAIRNKYINKFKLVIIDEIHMLGDPHRGATVEALVAKLRLLNDPPQIIGLSATISKDDAIIYGKWMNGVVYSCADRPSIISQYVVWPDGRLSALKNGKINQHFRKFETIIEDKSFLLPIVADTLCQNPKNTILIFVNSRKETRSYAKMIASYLYSEKFNKVSKVPKPSEEIIKMRQDLLLKMNYHTRFCNDQLMSFCITNGIAYHNAGLLIEERKFIEDSLRNGIINVVVATTTLSAGINITNVATVVIHNVFRMEGSDKIPLTSAQYNQMAGRAGRMNNVPGKVFILQHTMESREIMLIEELSKSNLNQISGHLLENSEFDRFFLQCLTFFPIEASEKFPAYTYEAVRQEMKYFYLDTIRKESLVRLSQNGLVVNKGKTTRLGKAIAGANFSIEEGLLVYENVKKAQVSVCLSDELHLLYLTIPKDIGYRTPPYKDDDIWIKLFNEHQHVICELLKISSSELYRRISLSHIQGGIKENDEIDKMLDKIYSAAILLEVINEKPVSEVEKMFNVDRGTIQSLQTNVSTFAGQVAKFCELCSFQVLAAAIIKFKRRLDSSVKNELLPLMSLPSCSQIVARILFNQGIESPEDIVNYKIDGIVKILMSVTSGQDPSSHSTSSSASSYSYSSYADSNLEKIDYLDDYDYDEEEVDDYKGGGNSQELFSQNGLILDGSQNSRRNLEILVKRIKKEASLLLDRQKKIEEYEEAMTHSRLDIFDI